VTTLHLRNVTQYHTLSGAATYIHLFWQRYHRNTDPVTPATAPIF